MVCHRETRPAFSFDLTLSRGSYLYCCQFTTFFFFSRVFWNSFLVSKDNLITWTVLQRSCASFTAWYFLDLLRVKLTSCTGGGTSFILDVWKGSEQYKNCFLITISMDLENLQVCLGMLFHTQRYDTKKKDTFPCRECCTKSDPSQHRIMF